MKSKIEANFDEVADRYFDEFGENYPLVITSQQPLSWHIERMKMALKEKKPCDVESGPDNGKTVI